MHIQKINGQNTYFNNHQANISKKPCPRRTNVSFKGEKGAVAGYIGGSIGGLALASLVPGPGWIAAAVYIASQIAGGVAGDKIGDAIGNK